MIERRKFLSVAIGGVAAACAPGGAAAQSAPPVQPTAFDPASVVEMARALAKKPYKAPAADLPDPFTNLTYESYVAIKSRPEAAIWADAQTGFVLEPLHRGFIFTIPMAINLVENGVARRLAYDPAAYDFGALKQPAHCRAYQLALKV